MQGLRRVTDANYPPGWRVGLRIEAERKNPALRGMTKSAESFTKGGLQRGEERGVDQLHQVFRYIWTDAPHYGVAVLLW